MKNCENCKKYDANNILCSYCDEEINGTIFAIEDKKVCESCFAEETEFKACKILNNVNKSDIHKKICEELTQLYINKNADYGDSFAESRNEIKEYTLGKLFDKYKRFKRLSREDSFVKSESIEDTLIDLANYAIMELLERRLKNG